MPEESPKGASLISAPRRSYSWVRPPQGRHLALLICSFGLLALLVSAISPADDSVQPDFSRHFRNGHRIVTASKLLQTGHLFRRIRAAAEIKVGAHAGPVHYPADHSTQYLPASLSSPGFEGSLAVRAPPACSSCSV